jgi:O-antigen/teichoic acid export membrane protein
VKKLLNKENSHYVGLLILVTTGLSSVLGFIYWFIAARSLETSEVGVAGGIVPAIGVTALVSSGGVGPLVLVLKEKVNSGFLKKLLALVLIVNILVSFIVALSLTNTETSYLTLVLVLLVGGVFTSFNLILDSIMLGHGKIYSFFIKNISISFSKIILILLIPVTSSLNLVLIWVAPLVIITSIFLIYVIFFTKTISTAKTSINDKYPISNWISSHFSVVLAQVAVLILPIIVLNTQGGAANASFYVALLLASASLMIPPAFSNSFLAKNYKDANEAIKVLKTKKKIVVGLQAITITLTLVIGDFLLESLGEGYSGDKLILGILLVAGLPNAFLSLNIGFLRKHHDLKNVLKLNAVTTVITIALAIIFSSFGTLFIALSFLVGQVVGGVYSAHLVRTKAKQIVGIPETLAQLDRNGGEHGENPN